MISPLLIAVTGAFVLVAMLAGSAASWWLAHNAPEQRRLRSLAPVAGGDTQTPQYAKLAGDELDPILARLSRLAARSPKEMSRLQRRMARAGYPTKAAAVYFALAQLALPVLFFGIAIVVPDFILPTSQARAVLPTCYTREDAIFNVQRAALLIAALAAGPVLDETLV